MGQFDTFTQPARAAVLFARDEALRLQHDYIGTEHLLLGLLHDPDELAARALNSLGVELVNARLTVEQTIGRGPGPVLGQIDVTSDLRQVLTTALSESKSFDHHYVGTEHVLLGLVQDPGQGARRVLDALGLFSADIRSVIADLRLRPGSSSENGKPGAVVEPETDPFDRLSPLGLSALQHARAEAADLGHDHVGVIHLLIGLATEERGVACRILHDIGVVPERLRETVAFVLGPASPGSAEAGDPTPRLRSVLNLAANEASRLGHAEIGTGHLLLGLAHAGNHIAAGICETLGVRLVGVIPLLERTEGQGAALD